jgi:hypothetical protein
MPTYFYARNDEKPDLGKYSKEECYVVKNDSGKNVDLTAEGYDEKLSYFNMSLYEPFRLSYSVEAKLGTGLPIPEIDPMDPLTYQAIYLNPKYEYTTPKGFKRVKRIDQVLKKDDILLSDEEWMVVFDVSAQGKVTIYSRGIDDSAWDHGLNPLGPLNKLATPQYHMANAEVKVLTIDRKLGNIHFVIYPVGSTVTSGITRTWTTGELKHDGTYSCEYELVDSSGNTTKFPRPNQEDILVAVGEDMENR